MSTVVQSSVIQEELYLDLPGMAWQTERHQQGWGHMEVAGITSL